MRDALKQVYQSGFEVTESPADFTVTVRRKSDNVSFRVSGHRVLADGIDELLRPFREYDAAQATPTHWMAL